MVTKLSQCQYALPLLIPEPFTEELQCPLWTFREIKKTWKKTETKDGSNVVLMKSMSICKAVTPMVFCLRLGDLSVSKSQLINTLINDRHSTFFHRNCPGNTKTQLLFEGMAEIAWYCPAGKPNDNFTDCVAFCNLHGDGLTHNKQMNILLEMSSINIVFVAKMDPTCGLEHIFREMAQIYEAHKCLDKAQTEVQTDWSKYPQLAAELLISGHPMELMDGDAGHVPLTWISSVMDQLIHRLGDKSVFVLSVLGIQSSGKSTLLNAMFGLQFAVSAGRCTRGTFMQLVKLSEELKTEFLWDYILVVDTEGLRALELEGNNTIHHDNELATFVVGLGNMTLVNIFGENPSEIQDVLQIVVQAFMRMKKVKLSPSCVFVHQNVSDVSAEEKNMYAKRKLQEKLDKMVELAAKEEECEAENFSDIIKFDVHKDVKYFAPLWEGTPPMAPTNPGYSESVQDLRNYILTKAKPSPGIKLSMFKTKVDDLWNALLNENFVFSFKNTLEIAVYRRLEEEVGKGLKAIVDDLKRVHVSALKTSRRTPDQILIDQLCDCCWEMCPFCGAVCTNSVKNHKLAKDGGMDHSVPFHRSPSVKGFHYKDTIEMSLPFCSTQVAGNATFHPDGSNRQVPYKRYREAGPPADTWSITPHHFQLSYWQWMVCTFKEDLEKNYNMKYYNHGEIPNEWKRVTLKKAIANLEEMYKTV
uniref:VLIG-type G domain-containing protein n=1 Tax=Knipowitschia caucasica TaxID=637954 RepID=A0AAV2K2E0_KNICA